MPTFQSVAFRVPIKSTWRDPVGPLLTDKRIRKWEKAGYYGDAIRRMILSNEERRQRIKRERSERDRIEARLLKRRLEEYV